MDWCLFDFVLLKYFPSLLCSNVKRIKIMSWGGGAENVVLSCPRWTGTPTQLALGVGVEYVQKILLVTFVLDGLRRSG